MQVAGPPGPTLGIPALDNGDLSRVKAGTELCSGLNYYYLYTSDLLCSGVHVLVFICVEQGLLSSRCQVLFLPLKLQLSLFSGNLAHLFHLCYLISNPSHLFNVVFKF